MIINEIRLFNFGVYSGAHKINLTPRSKEKPVVLIGALNGGGKTTLIDAIQLVLFGKLSKCSTRERFSYSDFLARSITRGVDPKEGAYVGMKITHSIDGAKHEFYIERSWKLSGNSYKENVNVKRDGGYDKDLSENWLEYVDQFVPIALAELFFFDGEKIEQIAESNNAAKMLSSAINSLLGLDLVERLQRDLITYQKDLIKRTSANTHKEITELEVQLEQIETSIDDIVQKQSACMNELDAARSAEEEADATFRKNGGLVYENRKAIESKEKIYSEKLTTLREEMRIHASDTGPLAILFERIKEIQKQASRERNIENDKLILETITDRDEKLVGFLSEIEATPLLLEKTAKHLSLDRETRANNINQETYLNLENDEINDLCKIDEKLIIQYRDKANIQIKQTEAIQVEMQSIKDTLSKVPDESAIAEDAKNLAECRQLQTELEAKYGIYNETIASKEREKNDIERKLKNILTEKVIEVAKQKQIVRKKAYADKVHNTMQKFKSVVLKRKIKEIEANILDSYKKLMRKKTLVADVNIDPDSYAMSLIGKNQLTLPLRQLSAGERQLLAISTLWGLARASGRQMPNVIDTPLARLDSKHRTNLIDNYFPKASHQVIILSTDEEIDKKYYPKLKDRISHSYELSYSDEEQSSVIRNGYFFE